MRISDWSSDLCSSDLRRQAAPALGAIPCLHAAPPRDAAPAARPSHRAARTHRNRRGADRRARRPPCPVTASRPLAPRCGGRRADRDRKSVVEGKRVSVRVDLGGRRTIKQKNKQEKKKN